MASSLRENDRNNRFLKTIISQGTDAEGRTLKDVPSVVSIKIAEPEQRRAYSSNQKFGDKASLERIIGHNEFNKLSSAIEKIKKTNQINLSNVVLPSEKGVTFDEIQPKNKTAHAPKNQGKIRTRLNTISPREKDTPIENKYKSVV